MEKNYLLLAVLTIGISAMSYANHPVGQDPMSLESLQKKQLRIDNEIVELKKNSGNQETRILKLEERDSVLQSRVDSLSDKLKLLEQTQEKDRNSFNDSITVTNESVRQNKTALNHSTIWGVVIGALLLLTLIAIAGYLWRKLKAGNSSISEVRKAQDALQLAQTRMQEESIKLDNKLLEIAEKQVNTMINATMQREGDVDHSLVLKVADEITKIELNLSRMDSSVRGYKQLSKAVQRMKDNLKANNYEIVDMLGKPYNEGMRVVANFVSDESLEQGKQIITGIIKPQVNYNGKMIQSAQITVSQNI